MDDSAEAVYQTKARAKSLLSNVWTHDVTERMKIRRKVIARDCGLGDIDVGTYPSHPAINVVETGGGGLGKWLGLLLAAGGGMGLLGSAQLLSPLLSEKAAAPAVVVPQSQEWELEVMSVDGEPVLKGVKRVIEEETD